MTKRIVEETLANGEKRYCVQSNTLFGIPCLWSTMTILTDSGVSTSAEFSAWRLHETFLEKAEPLLVEKLLNDCLTAFGHK